jgi:hypothetical protein
MEYYTISVDESFFSDDENKINFNTDLERFSDNVNDVIGTEAKEGSELVSITPITAGRKAFGAMASPYASFTCGVLLLFKKK